MAVSFSGVLLGTIFAFIPAEPQPCFKPSAVLKMEANRMVGCCFRFCCVASQPAANIMADRAKEESKMKLKVVSKPFDGYMSPAAEGGNKGKSGGGGGFCCSHCCHCCCSFSIEI